MDYEEALAWMMGKRSTTNIIPAEPFETIGVRTAQADAANTQQAYWVLRAYKEGLVSNDPPNAPAPSGGVYGDYTKMVSKY